MSNKNSKNKGGRPLFDGKDVKDVLAKLEQAALINAPVAEMCFYADISQFQYFRYIEKHPKFRERLNMFRERLALKSRQNIATQIEGGDVGLSKWMLERTKPDEYGETLKLDHGGQISHVEGFDPAIEAVRAKYHEEMRAITRQHYLKKKEPKT